MMYYYYNHIFSTSRRVSLLAYNLLTLFIYTVTPFFFYWWFILKVYLGLRVQINPVVYLTCTRQFLGISPGPGSDSKIKIESETRTRELVSSRRKREEKKGRKFDNVSTVRRLFKSFCRERWVT